MKAFNFSLIHPIYLLVGILMTSLTANAAVPEIDSPLTASATIDQAFSYTITTLSNDAILYGTSSDLPSGITRTGATLSGVPTETGEYNIRLDATNADGTDSKILVLTVSNPTPEIPVGLEFTGRVGESFSWTIPVSSAPDSFSEIGLSAIGGLTLDTTTGTISGTPTVDAIADVSISATNSAGTGSALIRITILSALTAPSIPAVNIVSPIANATFQGTDSKFTVVANVTPQPGETTDVVFVRWINPPAPLTQIIVANMMLLSTNSETGTETYTADVNLGFNPNDREVGGGDIQLEVVAYQTNAQGSIDAGIANVAFTVKPIIEILFPAEGIPMDAIEIGDVFASVRVSTNKFASVTARIAGASVVETVTINVASSNGVYNFSSSQRIDFPGFYDLRFTVLDDDQETTIVERPILISDALSEPVAVMITPTPGFINEVFSAASFSFFQTQSLPRTVTGVGVVGYDVTYRLTLINEGQGYYPRNGRSVTLTSSDAYGTTIAVSGITVANGRVTDLPVEVTTFYQINTVTGVFIDTPLVAPGVAIMDDLSNPGQNGMIPIAAQFFKANSELASYKLFVNGEDVTPGTGNLDPLAGVIDIPNTDYPGPGRGSPAPGDYIAYAQVTDKQGEVGTSEGLSFSIVPYEPIEITIIREGVGDIEQGDSDVIIAEVTSTQSINTVEFFDSNSTESSLGLASSVVIDGQTVYRFVHTFDQQGPGSIYAVATAFNGQSSRSNSIPFNVTPLNDLSVIINSPAADVTVFEGEDVTFVATADATPGVTSVAWVVSNNEEELDEAGPYEFKRLFDTVGEYQVLARGTDNFGNIVDSSVITVTVLASDLTVSLTSPVGDQTLVQGESLTFTASASASIGVGRVEWFVDGERLQDEDDTVGPYSLTYSFATVGPSSVFARAYDSVGNIASAGTITVNVNAPNPLLRDRDFVADIYSRLVSRAPTVDELATALAVLDGTIESRAALLAALLQSDNLQTATIASLIYLTMTGEYPDASELEAAKNTLTNGGTGATSADTLTASLWPEYESRFAVLNNSLGFVTQLFKNKHSGISPTPSSLRNLYNILTGGTTSIDDDGVFVVPGYSGNTTSYATQFALDNDLSGFQGVSGFPLTSLHYYSIPNRPAEDTLIVILITTLLGVEATDTEISALNSVSLIDAVTSVLTDSRYYGQFSTSSADGFVAQKMAALGVFDPSLSSASDDADADGVSNIAEILLNTGPLNISDEPTVTGDSSMDGTDFVFEFVRLKPSLTPDGASVVVECSDGTFSYMPVDDIESKLSSDGIDQSGIDSDYERVEFRVDTNEAECGFFRLKVE